MTTSTPRTSFKQAIRTIADGLRLVYDHIGPMALAGVVWWLAALSLIGLGPATLMLHRMARSAAYGKLITWPEIMQSWRADFTWSAIHSLGWLIGWLAILGNAQFYGILTASPLVFSLVLPFLLIWLAVGIFLYPAALNKGTRTLCATLREAWAMVVVSPKQTLVLWIAWICSTVVCLVVPILLFIWPSLIAAWGEIATLPVSESTDKNR